MYERRCCACADAARLAASSKASSEIRWRFISGSLQTMRPAAARQHADGGQAGQHQHRGRRFHHRIDADVIEAELRLVESGESERIAAQAKRIKNAGIESEVQKNLAAESGRQQGRLKVIIAIAA